ncbi:type ISP restriction/modification enzyme [Streptacidiphilus sp. N1-3]|uniref:Type ISP restriction/modification enzyme n=1 Tax=Streptacidiphilus alkalitolerans TaxID=3342712 RepID=A0ABV6X7Z3_9ACTN
MDRAPLLSELMPWSVAGLRTGRGWVVSPYPEVLVARWQRLAEAAPERRAALFGPSRSRTVDSSVAQLPGQSTSSNRLSREPGPCPAPVQIRHGAFDRLWLLPDQRLLDQARPELWRVADQAQVFATVQPQDPDGPALTFSAELPDGHRGRGSGRIHPLYRRPGGREPNLAPGLLRRLGRVLGLRVTAEDLLAWIAATTSTEQDGQDGPGRRGGEEVPVPLPADPGLWTEGVALGRRLLWLHSFGARYGDPAAGRPIGRPRMPGGRRPFVRERISGSPDTLGYEPETESVLLGDGRLAPVAAAAWEFRAGGEPVLAEWFARRVPDPEAQPGSLEALGLSGWPQQSTADLVDLATVLTLLADCRPALRELRAARRGPWVSAAELTAAGVLPVPGWCRRPASVLLHQEEGPEGQFALL